MEKIHFAAKQNNFRPRRKIWYFSPHDYYPELIFEFYWTKKKEKKEKSLSKTLNDVH